MRSDQLIGQLQELRTRATHFHQRATAAPVRRESLLDEALSELGVALEELRVTEDELRSQNDRLVGGAVDTHRRLRLAEERFFLAPDAMLETDGNGVTEVANRAAGELLGIRVDLLLGKPIAMFVPMEDRRLFRLHLRELARGDGRVEDWTMRVTDRSGAPHLVDVRARAVGRGHAGAVVWSLRARPQAASAPSGSALADELSAGDSELALRSVVMAAAALVPGAMAGVMLADADGVPRWVTSTDALAQAFEQAQAELRVGPCVDVLHEPTVVWTVDVTADPRWPELAPVLAGKGIGSVICAPLVLDNTVVGSFNLFTTEPVSWIVDCAPVTETLAAMSVLLLRSSTDLRRQQTLAEQLQHALHRRVLIEQAKGVLMARHGIDQDEAWTRLREAARITRRKAVDVAAEIVEGKDLEAAED